MQCKLNTNYSTPTFGTMHYGSGGYRVAEKLCDADLLKLNDLFEGQEGNPVKIYLKEGRSKKRFLVGIGFKEKNDSSKEHYTEYNQCLFQKPISFLEKMCKKADDLKKEYFDNAPNIDRKAILDKIGK